MIHEAFIKRNHKHSVFLYLMNGSHKIRVLLLFTAMSLQNRIWATEKLNTHTNYKNARIAVFLGAQLQMVFICSRSWLKGLPLLQKLVLQLPGSTRLSVSKQFDCLQPSSFKEQVPIRPAANWQIHWRVWYGFEIFTKWLAKGRMFIFHILHLLTTAFPVGSAKRFAQECKCINQGFCFRVLRVY